MPGLVASGTPYICNQVNTDRDVGGRNQLRAKSVLSKLLEQVNSLNMRGRVAAQGRVR